MSTATVTTGRSAGRDKTTYAGMSAVAVAAAVLSFSALSGLAVLAGVAGAVPLPGTVAGFRLAWLLPIAVDAYAVTATRVWLRADADDRIRTYARRNALGAIGLSVAGNAAYHALSAAGVSTLATVRAGWLVVVAVSAVPPVILGLVGHLHALVTTHTGQPAPVAVPPVVAPASTPDTDTGPDTAPVAEPVTGPDRNADTTPATEARRTRTRRRSARPVGVGTAAKVARLRERHPDLPVAELARRAGVSDRTVRRYLAAARTPDPAPVPAAVPAPAVTAPVEQTAVSDLAA